MAEKILNTKIALLYKTAAEWESIQETYIPLKGEVCFCEVPDAAGKVAEEPAILFKVGDGQKNFKELPWGHALAADVYKWAKKESLDWSDLSNDFKSELESYIKENSPAGEIVGTRGTSYIFNEADGGGSKFEGKDGGVAYVGTHDNIGGEIGTQIYVDSTDGSESTIIDVTQNGAYYTKGEVKPGEQRDVPENEIATVGVVDEKVEEVANTKVDKEIDSADGKALIFNEADGGGAKFEHTDGTNSFVGVNNGGSEGIAAQVYAIDSETNKGAKLDVRADGIYYTDGDESALPANQRDIPANKIATIGDIEGTIGGFKIVKKDTAEEGYLTTYCLEDDNGTQKGASINIPKDFLVKSAELKTVTVEDSPYEGAKIGDKYIDFVINVKEGEADDQHIYLPVKDLVDVYTADEETIHMENNQFSVHPDLLNAMEDELDNKLDIMPGDEHTGGNPYNLPYFFYIDYDSEGQIVVHAKTITLDGNKTQGDYTLEVPSADSEHDGLMSKEDKAKLDAIESELADIAYSGNVNDLVQDEGDVLILNCNF